MAEKIDAELDAIAPGQIAGVGAGQVLIADPSGVLTPRTFGGDATISATGTVAIEPSKVDTQKLSDAAVTSGKIATGAVLRGHVPKTFIQTKRVIILNQASGSTVEHTVSWDTQFSSLSYTPMVSILNSTTTSAGLRFLRFTSKSTSSVKFVIENTGAETSATLHLIAIAD